MSEKQESKWLPPGFQDLLARTLPEGTQWYELRAVLQCVSYEIQEFDTALVTTKCMKGISPSSGLYYCWVEDSELHEDQVY